MKTNTARRNQLEAKRAHTALQLRKLKSQQRTHVIGDVISQLEKELAAIDQDLAEMENNKDSSS